MRSFNPTPRQTFRSSPNAYFDFADDAFRKTGDVKVLKDFGADEAWYKHRGGIRAGARKIGTILINEIENLFVINAILFLDALDSDEFFKVVWVPPEIKDKAIEPVTSVAEQTGRRATIRELKDAVAWTLSESFGVDIEEGGMKRDEIIGYEKSRALAYRV